MDDSFGKLKTYKSSYEDITQDIKDWKIKLDKIFLGKSEFAENIANWVYDKELTIDTWKRFLPIFQKIEELVYYYSNREHTALKGERSMLPTIRICLLDKIKIFLRNFFK